MPKVILDRTDEQELQIYGFIEIARKESGLTQEDLADELGMSQQKFNYRFRKRILTIGEFIKLVKKLKPNDETILRLVRGI